MKISRCGDASVGYGYPVDVTLLAVIRASYGIAHAQYNITSCYVTNIFVIL